ncbi:MAG: hypothetical protein JWN57_668, partial [Frankiales bacterium]|nr:hypothetical protein [Frankiales bacterium]
SRSAVALRSARMVAMLRVELDPASPV